MRFTIVPSICGSLLFTIIFTLIAGSLAPASIDAIRISDRFELTKERMGNSWNYEDNSGVIAADDGMPNGACIGQFCSVDGQPGPQGPPGPPGDQGSARVTITGVSCSAAGLLPTRVNVGFTVSGVFHDSNPLTFVAQVISPSGDAIHSAEITVPANAPNPATVNIGFSFDGEPGTYRIIATPNGEFASASFEALDYS